ncbi:MAG TPA: helix-turn-helix transcriptional regulator [Actinomycetes bacterium]|nr:helix-turn-helix transcriptional regulator [Actinomycetes bacterium]
MTGSRAAGRRSPTRGQRLGATLRRLREQADLTIEQVAERLDCSASKVSRIETGQVSAAPRDVRDMLELYRVDQARRDALVKIAREARQPGWWEAYSGVSEGAPPYTGLETAAAWIHTYMALAVPSLLQTADYARAIIGAVRPDLSPHEVDRRVELRMQRQELLQREHPPAFRAILDEALLRRRVGTAAVMRRQLDRLVEAAAAPSVTVQVLPVAAGAHAGIDGPFTILGFPEPAEPDIVMLDSAAGNLYCENPEELRLYRQLFDLLRAKALATDESVAFIAALSSEL